MTAILMNDSHSGVPSHVHVWSCEGCRCVHIRAGHVLLTFTPTEFGVFTETVNDCYWQQEIFGLADDDVSETSNSVLQSEATN